MTQRRNMKPLFEVPIAQSTRRTCPCPLSSPCSWCSQRMLMKKKMSKQIYTAIKTLAEPNGSRASTIIKFLKGSMFERPNNFKKLLGKRLKRLVFKGRLEKVHEHKSFKIIKRKRAPKRPEMTQEEEVALFLEMVINIHYNANFAGQNVRME